MLNISEIKKNILDILSGSKTEQKKQQAVKEVIPPIVLDINVLAEIVKEISLIRQLKEGSLKYNRKKNQYENEKGKKVKPENILKPTFATLKPEPSERIDKLVSVIKNNKMSLLMLFALIASPIVRSFVWGALKELLIGKDGILPDPMKKFIKLFVTEGKDNPTEQLRDVSEGIDGSIKEMESGEVNAEGERYHLEKAADELSSAIEKVEPIQRKLSELFQKESSTTQQPSRPPWKPPETPETRPGPSGTPSAPSRPPWKPPETPETRPGPSGTPSAPSGPLWRPPWRSPVTSEKPESEQPRSDTSSTIARILDFVSYTEGTNGNYNMIYGGQIVPGLTSMTIAEVLQAQKNRSLSFGRGSDAVGKYQIMSYVLEEESKAAGISLDTKFDANTQDRLITHRLKRMRFLDSFLAKRISIEEFALHLAKEFASLPVLSRSYNTERGRFVERGQSYYTGDNLNKSSITPEVYENFLKGIIETSEKPQATPTPPTSSINPRSPTARAATPVPSTPQTGATVAQQSADVVGAKKQEEAQKKVATNVTVVATNNTTVVPRNGSLRNTLTSPSAAM